MVPRWRTCGSPIRPAQLGERRHRPPARSVELATSRCWVMAPMRRRARPVSLDAGEAFDLATRSTMRRRPRAAASSPAAASGRRRGILASSCLASSVGRLPHSRRAVIVEGVHRLSLLIPRRIAHGAPLLRAPARPPAASPAWRCLRVPMALVMALMTAAGAAMAPASPQPLMPSGLDGQGVVRHADLEGRAGRRRAAWSNP